ncbi:alpha/beta hydrolase [Acaryochloris sp. CCMEE 5410]|uniref:alpha/beta hydrolase n=1 Tax=Acaryochloris sp. CCMEE 5410 TaxID=310037 RepID=UPI0002484E44|nr:alpha/beta hydrolase [Acaryochloris sp. CCMEE 5410]KAI9134430.1 alpha/beta hydrolase [Acaryochloris sp. CCMEE 5410]
MKRYLQTFIPWGLASAVVMVAPLFGTEAQAAESIFVRYKETEVKVTRGELNTFTETGNIPASLQTLLNTEAELPAAVRTILSDQITVPTFLKNFLEGSNGEFLLFKLDQVISSTEGRTERGLNALKTAVLNSIEDDRVSFIEIIDKHPQNTIRVDITSLEGTYNDVSGFVERILPALEVAKGVLSDFICDCNTAEAAPKNGAQKVNHSLHAAENCEEEGTTTAKGETSQPSPTTGQSLPSPEDATQPSTTATSQAAQPQFTSAQGQ